MRASVKKASAVCCASLWVLIATMTTSARDSTTEVSFTISRGQIQPFVRQLVVESQGRIALDVTGSPKEIELTLLLRRPDGTVANQISGTGGNLSLTYFVTKREVEDSLATKNSRWSVEINKTSRDEGVSGRLKITQPVS